MATFSREQVLMREFRDRPENAELHDPATNLEREHRLASIVGPIHTLDCLTLIRTVVRFAKRREDQDLNEDFAPVKVACSHCERRCKPAAIRWLLEHEDLLRKMLDSQSGKMV
jgi:hypothetical protein